MRKEIGKILVLAGMIPLAASVQALTFQPTEDVKVSVDTILSYGGQWRMDAPDKNLIFGKANDPASNLPDGYEWIQRTNADDGSRNFGHRGDQTSNRYGIVSDIDISYKNIGFFTRLQGHYDSVYFEKTDWYDGNNIIYTPSGPGVSDPLTYENQTVNNEWGAGNINSVDHFGRHAKDSAADAGILDAYAYGAFDVDGHSLNLRVGRQVISWGEALILQGGIGFAQNRINAQALTSPGAELKEGFLPTGSVFAQLGLTESLTLETYWMYEFIPSTLTSTGTFFSSQDFIEGGGGDWFFTQTPGTACPQQGCQAQNFGNGQMRLHNDWLPEHEANQWGIALRKLLDDGSELGVYMVNYHDKYPSFYAGVSALGADKDYTSSIANNDGMHGNYQIRYADDIRLYGLTYATVIGDVQMGFELAYRANSPVVTGCTKASMATGGCGDPTFHNSTFQTGEPLTLYAWPVRAEVVNWDVGATYIFNPSPLWDTATFVAELGGWYIGGMANSELKNAWLGGFTQYGEGVSGVFRPEYKNVLEGLDIVLPFFFNYTIDGSYAVANYTEHNLWLSWGVEARYLANWDFSLIYSDFSGQNNLWGDRDNISLTAKYSF